MLYSRRAETYCYIRQTRILIIFPIFEGSWDVMVSCRSRSPTTPCKPPPAVQYSDVIMGAIASQIISLTSVYLTDYSGADQRKYQSSASLAFVCGIHRWPVKSQHKWPVTRKMLPFDDFIMVNQRTPRIGFSSTPSCDLRPLAVTYGDFKVMSDVNLSQGITFWNK